MAKRFVKSKLYNTWNGKAATEKANYKDSVIFVEDRKVIIEGNADGDGFVEFDGRTPVAGEGIVVSELSSAQGPYIGQWEIEHADTSNQASITASGRKYITGVTLDDFGHVTGLTTGTETVTDTNTTYDLTTTASTTNAKVNLVAGGSGSGTDTVTITGAGSVSVKSDASGNVTITGATIPTNHKTKQTAKTDPTASGNSSTFIASITQNENGEITATKKNVSISVSAGATDDDVVILTGTAGTNGVSYDAKHAEVNASVTNGTAVNVSGYSGSGSFTVPKITTNKYGHVTAVENIPVSITMPGTQDLSNYKTKQTAVSSPAASGNATAFIDTISQDANGNITVTKKNISAADLGLTNALKFKGVVDTLPTSYKDYVVGDVILCSNKEYVLSAKTSNTVGTWTELGDEGSHALKTIEIKGTGVLSGGGTLEANRNITHNEVLGTAITTAKGGVSGNTITVPTIKADKYGHLTAVGTADYTVPTALKNPNAIALQSNGTQFITYDGSDSQTINFKQGTGITISGATSGDITISAKNNGTVTKITAGTGLTGGEITSSGTIALATSGVTAGTYGDDESSRTLTHSDVFDVPQITVDAYGRITSATTKTLTLPASGDSDKKTSSANNSSKMYIIGATSQSSDGVTTYSNTDAYITNGALYSEGYKVINSNDWEWEVLE